MSKNPPGKIPFGKKKLSGAANRKRKIKEDAALQRNTQPITRFTGILFEANQSESSGITIK